MEDGIRIIHLKAPSKFGGWMILLGALAGIVGSFMPWFVQGDQIIDTGGATVFVLLLSVLALIFRFMKRVPVLVVSVLGVGVLTLGAIRVTDPQISYGLYITLAAGALMFTGPIVQMLTGRRK